jgi:hypothetical protein
MRWFLSGGYQMVLWMMGIAISVCLLVISAAIGAQVPIVGNAHLIIAGLVSTVMALLAIGEARKLIQVGASDMMVTGSLMGFMGLIWAWAALAISITYGTGILEWSAWWQYFAGSMVLAGLFLFSSRLLCVASHQGRDQTKLRITQYMAGITLLATVTAIAFCGLNQLNTVSAIEIGTWAAENVFFFGAFALAAISSYLLKASVNEAH